MFAVASDTHRVHHPHGQILDAGRPVDPPEVPERAERIRAALAESDGFDVHAPETFGLRPVERIHTVEYLEFLEHAHARWCAATGLPESSEATAYARPIRDQPLEEPLHVIAQLGWYSHDSDPILAGTWEAATGAVDVTLTAWQAVANGSVNAAYALARPPG